MTHEEGILELPCDFTVLTETALGEAAATAARQRVAKAGRQLVHAKA